MHVETTPAVALEAVRFGYAAGAEVLHGVDLRIERGEFVAVAGPNGGGKTTLVRLLLGLERPLEGSAMLFGEPAHAFSRRQALGYLAQRTRLGTEAPTTVREVVAAGTLARGGLLGPLRRRERAIVDEAIARVGLADRAGSRLQTLSGGQQQRAFIAKALAVLLARLHDELGTTIVYVSHEFGAVERHVERLLLVRGTIIFDGPPANLPGFWHDPSHVHV